MTKEDYIKLKHELKEKGKRIRSLKKLYREDESCMARGIPGSGTPYLQSLGQLIGLQKDVRSKHVFMSLLRGRTRVEIENNFNAQAPVNGLYSGLERRIKDLCEFYQVQYEVDENYKVMTVIRHDFQRDVA